MALRKVEENSPYYVHPGENPSLVLVSTILANNGSNYHTWARDIKMALLSKNKLDFIDGTIEKPSAQDSFYKAWRRCNNLILSWINKSLPASVAQTIVWHEDAKTVWDSLKERFAQSDSYRLADLQAEIFTFKQGNRSITDYFSALQVLWDEYIALRPIPTCICNGCICDLEHSIKRNQEKDLIICFLKGLNGSFDVVRSQIMCQDPLPAVNKVFSLVLQHERTVSCQDSKIEHLQTLDLNTVAFANEKRGYSSQYPKDQLNIRGQENSQYKKPFFNRKPLSTMKCLHCGDNRHTIDTCYKVHGYPPGYQNRKFRGKANFVNNEGLPSENSLLHTDMGIIGSAPLNNTSHIMANHSLLSQEQLNQIMKYIQAQPQSSFNPLEDVSATQYRVNAANLQTGNTNYSTDSAKHGLTGFEEEEDWFS